MSKPFFKIEMLAAKHGDALLVEYGNPQHTRRILIDGGPLGAYPALENRLSKIPSGAQSVELLVVTHVDTDHIEGIIRLLAMPESKWRIYVKEVWFNGWRHIEEAQDLGGWEGEFMSALIHYRLNDRWNTKFNHNAVRCGALSGDEVEIDGGMKLTMLSPDAEALAALLKDWKKNLAGGKRRQSINPGDLAAAWAQLVKENKFHPGAELTLGPGDLTDELNKLLKGGDPSKANGSSIAFIAEFEKKSCMFLGDAHMKVVCKSLKGLGYSKENPVRVNAVKVSHHGSKNNITKEFLELVDATHWLFSSNGDKHSHPDKEAVEAVIQGAISKPTLWFNYRSPFTEIWEEEANKPDARYHTKYPAKGKDGIVVKL
jgi:beta-lactamase superfamily II metal-dependent hydrolase